MGDFGFDQAVDTLKDGLDSLADTLGIGVPGTSEGPLYELAKKLPDLNDTDGLAWQWSGQDWYKIYGYQFVVVPKKVLTKENSGDKTPPIIYTLPIPPQSLNIRMIPASQATPTIGGVVEETNANVFWLINMSGTTGIAVSRKDGSSLLSFNQKPSRAKMAQKFRDTISTTGLLSGALAGINSAISKIGGAADALVSTADAVASGNVAGAAGGLVGAFNTLFLPPLPYSASAVSDDTNGYTEIQELHRFLYTYSKLKQKYPTTISLKFRCYKTGQLWDCILQDFSIQQSAQNPMLYRYNISLKGWNVRDASDVLDVGKIEDFDRFGPNGDLKAVNLVNPAVFGQIKNKFFASL